MFLVHIIGHCFLKKSTVSLYKYLFLFRNVRIQTLNPKAVSLDELYGAVNLATMEWKDGLLGTAVRTAVNVVG